MFPGPDLVIQAAPKIFIYDIPAYSNCMHAEGGEALIYGTEQILPKALRQSQIYITKDPEEADFFYVDAHLYCIEGGGKKSSTVCWYPCVFCVLCWNFIEPETVAF